MSGETLACPYCNAVVPPRPGMAAGQKVSCPRCGEVFTLRHTPPPEAIQPPPGVATAPDRTLSPAPSLAPSGAPTPPLRSKPVRANRIVAAVVLSVMALMAVTGLTYALLTQSVRRAHDSAITRKPRKPWQPGQLPEEPFAPSAAPIAPPRLPALGYLPPDTSLALGIHAEELLGSPAGKELLSQPLRVADREVNLDNVLGWTGFALDEIDQAALGLKPDEPTSAVLVLRTRKSYDEEAVRARLKARRSGAGKRPIYRFEAPGLRLPTFLWCADARTLVVGFSESRLEALPAAPDEGPARLAAPVRQILEERVGPSAPLWVAGYSSNWADTALGLLLAKPAPPREEPAKGGRARNEDLERLRNVRTFALWVVPGAKTSLTLNAAVRCASAEAARDLEASWLRPALAGKEQVKLVRDGEWLTVQAHTDLSELRNALER